MLGFYKHFVRMRYTQLVCTFTKVLNYKSTIVYGKS
jgi:hypothetical protein